jgi:hypothetical protein
MLPVSADGFVIEQTGLMNLSGLASELKAPFCAAEIQATSFIGVPMQHLAVAGVLDVASSWARLGFQQSLQLARQVINGAAGGGCVASRTGQHSSGFFQMLAQAFLGDLVGHLQPFVFISEHYSDSFRKGSPKSGAVG